MQELKSKAYDVARKIEQLNYAFQQQLQPLQQELQSLNKQIFEAEQAEEANKAESKK